MRKLEVELGERSYPIWLGSGILSTLPDKLLERGIKPSQKLWVITDEHVAPHYLDKVVKLLTDASFSVTQSVVGAGEKSKSLQQFERLMTHALENGLDRKSVVLALGGGVVGDLAGYVAASFMRGISFVQIPTTVLAHDSSVGGKVAVNHPLAKNIIGAFHQPEMVLYDLETFSTLPDREIRNGLAEVLKEGWISDESFVVWLEQRSAPLLNLDPDALEEALYRGCQVKVDVVSRDEKENDVRAILNFGHTVGHAIEAVGEYSSILHGEAISIGMVIAVRISEKLGMASQLVNRIERLLEQYGLPTRIPRYLSTDDILAAMSHDKKFQEGRTLMILTTGAGKVEICRDVPLHLIREAIEESY